MEDTPFFNKHAKASAYFTGLCCIRGVTEIGPNLLGHNYRSGVLDRGSAILGWGDGVCAQHQTLSCYCRLSGGGELLP